MTPMKRFLDVLAVLVLAIPLLPLGLLMALAILILDGRPVLYWAERMKTPTQGFKLAKFRSMTVRLAEAGVSGGDKTGRITRTGRFMRRTRLDELPQLWNVLKGDISFVGPRPPLREYVERFPTIYAKVLKSRPGITGLATIVYHRHEEILLSRSKTAAETDAIYARACVPRKARLDLIYQQRRNLCFDFYLMLKTVFKRLPL
ncbi:MAG: Sugar transferase [Cypionkella sp.]|uniref:sugar transferase n=1 Tax=Cypionkella sp. TaxID=2811411 RepID=UPI002613770C|nr:sugar transferase [Cypionkella sp.]MDB5658881.1 Sugar transferase [Cypionkella sp.]MDB5665744.1 Sugar transferase [Cypionkella sp.]